MTTTTVNSEPRTYGNWRRPTSPGIGSLGLLATMILLGGTVAAVISAMVFWPLALGMVFLTIVTLVPMAIHDRYGRNGFQVLLPHLAQSRAARTGTDLYRSGPLSRVPQGQCRLPGLAAGIEALDALDAWGRPFAVLSHPHVGQVTAVIAAASDGAALVDGTEVDNRVAHWGGWLADLGHEPGLVAASVTIEAAPDTGTRLRQEVEHNLDQSSPRLAQDVLASIIDTYPTGLGGHGLLRHPDLVDRTANGNGEAAESGRDGAAHRAAASWLYPHARGNGGGGGAPHEQCRVGRVLSHLL